MTEIQKEIIEIIEPFMDKTLDKGCLVQLGLLTEKKYRLQTILNSEERGLINYYTLINLDNQITEKTYRDFIKVIGYYDITAVLKYIESKLDKNYFIETTLNNFKVIEIRDKFENKADFEMALIGKKIGETTMKKIFVRKYSIPNKTLSLYTEEENKNLLELLKQLGKKK